MNCGMIVDVVHYFKGYILEKDRTFQNPVYLWHYSGQLLDNAMKEIHLFIPTSDFQLPRKQGKYAIKPCYLDTKSGFINFKDDSNANNEVSNFSDYICGGVRPAPAVVPQNFERW